MDKDTKFALLAIGVPFVGLLYCAIILAVIFMVPAAQNHPIITATIFVLAPSLISGSLWLWSSYKSRKNENLGL